MTDKQSETKLIVNGKRPDGRKLDELREIEARAGVIKRADGSGYFRLGNSIAVAAVYGPKELHPKHLVDPVRAYVKCRYNMAPFSTTDRIRPGPSRRSTEISKVIKEAISSIVFLEEYPETSIEVFIEILQADASTRCAGLNAASIALADAGIPMKDLIVSCSAGKVEGQMLLDVAGVEDCEGEVDLPIAYVPRENKLYLLQMDGIISKEDIKKGIEMVTKGCKVIYDKQKEALKRKYEIPGKGGEEK